MRGIRALEAARLQEPTDCCLGAFESVAMRPLGEIGVLLDFLRGENRLQLRELSESGYAFFGGDWRPFGYLRTPCGPPEVKQSHHLLRAQVLVAILLMPFPGCSSACHVDDS